MSPNLLTFLRVLAVSAAWKLRRREPLSMGRALVGQLMIIARRLGVALHLQMELTGLGEANGRISAVRVVRRGETYQININKAVLIAAGGFARDDAYRRCYQPVGSDYSAAHPDDKGEPIRIAGQLGAATAMMEEAWWMPVVLLPDGRRCINTWERSMPHSIIVDQSGQRYFNEAEPYNDAGRLMLDRHASAPSIPSWLITDARHRANYAFAVVPTGFTPRSWIRSGFFIKASSLDELATRCGIEPENLVATLERFNRFAHTGRDEDFCRGDQAFDRARCA